MKKSPLIAFLLCLITIVQLSACGGQAAETPETGQVSSDNGEQQTVSQVTPDQGEEQVTPLPVEDGVELTMAMSTLHYESSYYDALMESYQQESNVVIRKVDYGEDDSQLMLSMAAGDMPDLLMSFWNDGILTEKGYLMDVYPYMDEDAEIHREDFHNLDMLCYGEQLTRVSPGYQPQVTFGLSDVYGDIAREDWNLEAFLSRLQSSAHPEEITGNSSGLDFLLDYTVSYASQYVDYQNGTCDYETQTFLDLLEAAAQVQGAYAPDATGAGDTYSAMFAESPELIQQVQIQGVAGYTILQEELVGCPVTFLGYPTSQGGKAQVLFVTTISGCSGTQYPDAVWGFLKYVLTADIVTSDTTMFPVYTKALEQQLTQAVETYGTTPVSKTPMGLQEALGKMLNLESLEPSFSQESADLLRTLLYQDSIYGGYDGVITPIVQEEASGFLAGDKTAPETAALIQNRVRIYLAEQQ